MKPMNHPLKSAKPSYPEKTLKVSEKGVKELRRITGLFKGQDKRGMTFYSGTDKESNVGYFLVADTQKGSTDISGYSLRFRQGKDEFSEIGKAVPAKDKNGSDYLMVKAGDSTFFIYDYEPRAAK